MPDGAPLEAIPVIRPAIAHCGRHAADIGRLAIGALYREVVLAPKPGLVSPADSGSHADMDFSTFMRSLVALRHYFPAITALGAVQPAFQPLQRLGREAEQRMLAATGGVNTHRGAIFNLGVLCAAAGALVAQGAHLAPAAVCSTVAQRWGDAIRATARPALASHGAAMWRRHGSGGARCEAAGGFPAVLGRGLPVYRCALAATGDRDAAAVQALFALMAELEDTNLLWRGGVAGLEYAQAQARCYLNRGGVLARGWREAAHRVHADFVSRGLSPGGSADLLGVTLFLHSL